MLTVPVTKGEYHTPSTAACWPLNLMPTPGFYVQAFWIVFRAALMAKKGMYIDGDWALSSLRTIRALERCGAELDIRGLEHVQASHEPCVFIGNHMSTLETFALPTLIAPYRRVTFVIKQSLIDYPLFKHVMRSRDPVVVNRSNPREDLKVVLEEGIKRLKQGVSIVVFPQTTRTTEFAPEHFNSIGIKLAQKAGVPVIPLALKTDAWGNGQRLKDFGRIDPSRRIHIEFGAPMAVSGQARDAHQQIIHFIQDRLQQWQ
ncbi:MAG: 1-acyl-sn-glycerol-3-phosphate acyltransferase [Desulfuromonadaceae bacterium]|nr:1-acyl-sn-glycerol-3-phosphate acyltransferase [Desulfuromonadaceae bacterium]